MARETGNHDLGWLNALKGIAILAVVIDHGFLVDNYVVWKHLYFSVSLFVFLAGVSNTYSARRRCFQPLKDSLTFWRKRMGGLLGPYLVASGIAYLLLNLHQLSAITFLEKLALFNGLPPLYFVPLLLQLLVVFPILFAALYLFGRSGKVAVALTIVPVAAILSRVVTFPWVLGAHYLFGASFLYLFVLGMLAEPYLSARRPGPLVWLACGLPLLIWAERLNLVTNGDVMTHPPSNVLVLYTVALVAVCYALCCQFPRFPPVRVAAQLGRHSLAIFLYHYLFILPILQFRYHSWTGRLPIVGGQVAIMALAIPVAIVGSILTARALTEIRLRGWSIARTLAAAGTTFLPRIRTALGATTCWFATATQYPKFVCKQRYIELVGIVLWECQGLSLQTVAPWRGEGYFMGAFYRCLNVLRGLNPLKGSAGSVDPSLGQERARLLFKIPAPVLQTTVEQENIRHRMETELDAQRERRAQQ